MRQASVLLLVLTLSACATRSDKPLSREQITGPVLKLNMQTLVERFGEPQRKLILNGSETWIYREENSSGFAQLKGNCELEIGFTLNEVTRVTLNERGTTPLAQPLEACRPFYEKLN